MGPKEEPEQVDWDANDERVEEELQEWLEEHQVQEEPPDIDP